MGKVIMIGDLSFGSSVVSMVPMQQTVHYWLYLDYKYKAEWKRTWISSINNIYLPVGICHYLCV